MITAATPSRPDTLSEQFGFPQAGSTRASNPVLIIGAGMAGMLAALFIRRRQPRREIIVVERSDAAGGHFRGLDLPGFGYCDRAMRVLYETGIPEFDCLLHEILPASEWHVLPDNIKDVVGIYWRGQLQTHSAYLDLRRLPQAERQLCEQEILARAERRRSQPHLAKEDAASYLEARFGPTVTGHLTRVLEKFYRVPVSTLHESATYQPVMNRVVLYDENRMLPVLNDDILRSVIAWPEQLTFPLKRQPPQAGLYPRRFGMNRVIDRLAAQLLERNVRILFNRKVSFIDADSDSVRSVQLDDGTRISNPSLVINANGLQSSIALLRGPGGEPLRSPAPPRCWMVFIRSQKPLNMDGLYHFWCFDEKYQTFRVTNYTNYCPGARNGEGYPACVEVWSEDSDAGLAAARAHRELQEMGILDPENRVTSQATVQGPNLHALCTLEYVQHLRSLREEVRARSPQNMITVGPFVEDGVMLLYEVSRQMHSQLSQRI